MNMTPEERASAAQQIALLNEKLESARSAVDAQSIAAWIKLWKERETLIKRLREAGHWPIKLEWPQPANEKSQSAGHYMAKMIATGI
jgi:hypothetical protein